MDLFNPEFFISNRARLRRLFMGTAPIILTANGLLQRNSDITFPFRQDSSFWYLTGIEEPGVVLVMDKTKDYLILPSRPKHSDLFDGPIDTELLTTVSGIETVLDNQTGWRQLGARLKRSKHAAVLAAPPAYIEEYGFYTNPARAQLNSLIKDVNSDISFLDIRNQLVKLRSIKQPLEIEAISQAINITINTFKKIKKNLGKYDYERDIETEIIVDFKKQRSQPAFPSIIASGKNACTIHYEGYDSKLNDKELLLIDIAAEVSHYSSDIARTLGRIDKLSKRQKQVFNAVAEVQNFAFSLLKPGIIPKEYESQVEHHMGEKLRELGLIKTIDRDSVRKYFPTLTSHFLGLDTHDIGDYSLPLEENMIITVEPGIYIPEEAIGVRIEDDVLITKTGIKNLSADLLSSLN